uniref:Ras-related protein Rab-14 n=1 Tax=Ascaris lumbricoides TaxID=6252 RepID=A0A0M3HWC9_ASCLU
MSSTGPYNYSYIFKYIIIGDMGVGKSCLLHQFTEKKCKFRAVTRSYYRGAAGALMVYDITRRSTYNHLSSWLTDARNLTNPNTVIFLIGNKSDLDGQRDVTYEEAKTFADENGLTFLECSAKTFRAVTRSYYRGAAGALMVYDITRRSTYNHLSSWLTDARNLTNPNTVIFLIGNKSDLDGQRDVTYEEAKTFADENGLTFLECSAKTGDNVEDAFLDTARKIYQNIQDGSGDNVEDAFLDTARKIYQNIQDGSLDLNQADTGVQPKQNLPRTAPSGAQDGKQCNC